MQSISRRAFVGGVLCSPAAFPFLGWLPSVRAAAMSAGAPVERKQRLVILFSPNGVVTDHFWPRAEGVDFDFPTILEPLVPFRDQTLILNGISNKIRGDGDNHMRGMSCLLTAIELFPGNIQGGSHTPAGWPQGISIDQELKNFLQANPATRTRLGSLELGVLVPQRADPWTRMCYTGPNRPVPPSSDPRHVFQKLYGRTRDRETLHSAIDPVMDELRQVESRVSSADRHLLREHLEMVRGLERKLAEDAVRPASAVALPEIPETIRHEAGNMPELSRLQIELLVHALQTDACRVASLQYTNSVGNAKMTFLGIEEGHHELSHDPDLKTESQEKLVKINHWYCQQVALLAARLAETPEPDGSGSLLDNTTIVWTNELGKGNSHTLDNIPFVLVGAGAGFTMGRSLRFKQVPHNRLWISLAQAMGHSLETFGNPKLSAGGRISRLFSA